MILLLSTPFLQPMPTFTFLGLSIVYGIFKPMILFEETIIAPSILVSIVFKSFIMFKLS